MDIVKHPHPILKTVSTEVTDFESIRSVVLEMMTHVKGTAFGLAANQVGIAQRFFVADIDPDNAGENIVAFINPKIIPDKKGGMVWAFEGCLSLDVDTLAMVERWFRVTIEACDIDGRKFEMTLRGLPARIAQHEYDHLNGKTLKEKRVQQWSKIKRGNQ